MEAPVYAVHWNRSRWCSLLEQEKRIARRTSHRHNFGHNKSYLVPSYQWRKRRATERNEPAQKAFECFISYSRRPNKVCQSHGNDAEVETILGDVPENGKETREMLDYTTMDELTDTIFISATPDRGLVSQSKHSEVPQSSAVRDIISLALPALGSIIADPLMSLVDTACVGQLSSLQLAALGPNTAIFNFVFQMFAFLGIVTTNMVASNLPSAPNLTQEERRRRTQKSGEQLSHALTVAALCGAVCCGIMLAVPHTILKFMGASAEMMPYAASYLRIRALACPAVMVLCVAQGACLGQQDAKTPLKIFVTAAVFNLVWDIFLISHMGMGITGAAIATACAQYVATAIFLRVLWSRGKDSEQSGSVPLRWSGFPSLASLKPFWAMSTTLVARIFFQMIGYGLVTYAATSLGTVASAAHQVCLQLLWFMTYVPEPLSVTAQSLIARDIQHSGHVQRMAKLLSMMGAGVGVALGSALVGIFTFCPRLFTPDMIVIEAIRSLRLPAFVCLCGVSLLVVLDGISIGSSDFEHLPRTMLISSICTWGMLQVSSKMGGGLVGVWWSLVMFFFMRFAQHALHIFMNWSEHPLGASREEASPRQSGELNMQFHQG